MKAPKIIDKNFDTLVEEDLSLAAELAKKNPEWKWSHQEGDVGLALLKIFAHMREEVISRLNRVPEKNFTAFLDMLGIDLLPAQPARVPVTFFPSEGRIEDVLVPEGTQVAAEETERHEAVTFETIENISITHTSIIGIYSVDPNADAIYNHYNDLQKRVPFTLFSGTNIQKHVLYLGCNQLLEIKEEAKIEISIEFDKAPSIDISRWNWRCWDGETENKFLVEEQKIDSENIRSVVLIVPVGGIKEKEVNGKSCLWVQVEPEFIDASYSSLRIKDIKVGITRDSLLPDGGYYSSFGIDPARSFYPFGTEPRILDMFYLVSDEAFSKKGKEVTISFTGNSALIAGSPQPLLEWEYWNGAQWKTLLLLHKNSAFDATQFKGNLSFVVPLDSDKVDVNGRSSYMIRARLMDNGYLGGYDESSRKFKFSPPQVTCVLISYELKKESLNQCLTYNSLEYENVIYALGHEGFMPFLPPSDEHPTAYLALNEALRDGAYSLFFHLSDKSQLQRENAALTWQCLAMSPSQEKIELSLEVKDYTEQLSRSDVLQVIGPSDQLSSSNFGSNCFWLKGVFSSDSVGERLKPNIRGIYLNTVWAEQRETIYDEILGSSDGEKKRKYSFFKKPIVYCEIWVREGAIAHEDEEEKPLVQNVTDEKGKVIDTWVKWKGVEDFFISGPRSRHYILDGDSGQIAFGDGTNGMIPPIGSDNIKATYRWGGGAAGNVDEGEISTLKSAISGIDKVINNLSAGGGSDTESMSSVHERGPWIIKHRDRAVTTEDFERLARASSSLISRVKCLTEGFRVKIIIVPQEKISRPMPSLQLLDTVSRHLQDRCLCALPSNYIDIQGPNYREVVVSAEVIPTSINKAVALGVTISQLLNNYLHPLTGGPDGEGWAFGRGVYISDIYAMLERTEGVDHVQNLKLNKEASDFSIRASEIICSGNHRISIKLGA